MSETRDTPPPGWDDAPEDVGSDTPPPGWDDAPEEPVADGGMSVEPAPAPPAPKTWADKSIPDLLGEAVESVFPATKVEETELDREAKDVAVYDALSTTSDPDKVAAIKNLAAKTGVSERYIEDNFDRVKRSWEASQYNARKWREENPQDARLFYKRPDLAGVVGGTEQLTTLAKAMRGAATIASSFAEEATTSPGRAMLTVWPPSAPLTAAYNVKGMLEKSDEVSESIGKPGGAFARELSAAVTPQWVETTADERAAAGKEAGTFGRAYMRYEDKRLEAKIGANGFLVMLDDFAGDDTRELEAEIAEDKRKTGNRDYLPPDASTIDILALSSADVVGSMATMATGAVPGAAVGALVGIPGGPAGVGAGALAGAQAGGGLATFPEATGSAYLDLRDTRTEDGKLVDRNVAMGGAVISGIFESGSEYLSFGASEQIVKSLFKGYAGGSVRSFVSKKMISDPAFRAGLVQIAKDYFNFIVKEPGEEMVAGYGTGYTEAATRTYSRDGFNGLTRIITGEAPTVSPAEEAAGMSLMDAGPEAASFPPEPIDHAKIRKESVAGAVVAMEGMLGLGLFGGGVSVASQYRGAVKAREHNARVSSAGVAAAVTIGKSPVGIADPAAAAASFAETVHATTGVKPTHFYAEVEDLDKLFQTRAEMEEKLGADVAADVAEARVTGDKVAVTIENFMSKWSKVEGAEKFADIMSMNPNFDAKERSEARSKADAEEVAALTKEYASENMPAPQSGEQEFRNAISRQLAAAGGYTLADARAMAAPLFAGIRNMASKFPDPSKVWGEMTLRVEAEGKIVTPVALPVLEEAKKKRLAAAPETAPTEAPAAPVAAIPGAEPAVSAPGAVVAPAPAGEVAPAAPASATPAPAPTSTATVAVVPSKDGGAALEYRPADTRVADEAADMAERPASYILSRVADEQFALPAKERAKVRGIEYGIDALTGLLNGRSFNAIPLKKGWRVAIVTAHDIKPINDHPTHGGHDEANKAMIAIAASLSKQKNVARTGADFSFHVKTEAEFEAALAKVQADIGQNIAITGITGPDFEATNTALTAKVDALRESGEWAPRGVASKGLDVPSLKFTAKKVEGVVPPKALVDQVKDLPAKDYFELVYLDAVKGEDGKLVKTGLMSAEGFARIPPKAYTLAYDMRGLRLANLEYGKPAGNKMLLTLGGTMSDLGASRLDGTHVSGDEYRLQSNDPLELAAFAALHGEFLSNIGVEAVNRESGKLDFLPVGFRHGIGTDYAAADRDLNSSRIAEAGGVRPPTQNDVPGSGGVGPGERTWRVAGAGKGQGYVAGERVVEGARGEVERLESKSGDIELGSTTRDAAGNLAVTLTPNADLSTFLHETAHVFHFIMRDLAARPDAPQSIKDDWQASLKYMGVEEGATPTTKQYEKFARAFERYLYEGKAPSEKMRSPFLRFSLWMRGVYRNLAGSPIDVQLSDEVVGVFDRLLASDEEIDQQSSEPRNARMFTSAEEAGMTEEQFRKYVEDFDAATLDAARRTEAALLNEHKRIAEDWWKTEERRERELAMSEYAKLPAVIANRRMRSLDDEGKKVSGQVTPLNAKEVRRVLGTDAIPKGILARPDAAMTPDVAAELYGFPTGKALLDALAELKDEDTWVKETARARMEARYPDMLAERERLSNAVAKNLMGDEDRTPLAVRELNIVRGKVGLPPVRTENFKKTARDLVATKAIGSLSYRRLDLAANRSAVKAAKAVGAKDWKTAAEEKRRHVLDIYVAKEARAAVKKRDSMLTLTKKLGAKTWMKKAGIVSPGIRDGAAGILHNIGESIEPAALDTLGKVIPEFERIGAKIGEDLFTVDDVIKKSSGDWQTMSVKDFEVVFGALNQIRASINELHSVFIDGKKQSLDEFKSRLLSEALRAKGAGWNVPLTPEGMTRGERVMHGLSSMDASSDKQAEMLMRLGGGDIKSAWYSIFLTVSDAMAAENDLMVEFSKPLLDLMAKAPTDVDMMGPVDGKALFPKWSVKGNLQVARPTRVFEIAMMLLHTGTVSSQERLTQGYNITLDEVRRAADLHLSPKTIAWVQAILDMNERMWPKAAALEERAEGIAPKKLERVEFPTMHGTISGYMPAVYDSRVEKAGSKQEKDYMDPGFISAGTSNAYLQNRVEGFTGALSLRPGTIMRHFNGVAHDISHREALRSVGKIINDQEVKAMMIGVLGQEQYASFNEWLMDVGVGVHSREMKGAKFFDAFAKAGKTYVAIRALAGAIPTPLGDLSNLPRAVIGSDLKTSYLMDGLYESVTSPRETYRKMIELSAQQRARSGHISNELALGIANEMKSPLFNSDAVRMLLDYDTLFMTLRASEIATRTPIWMGAFRQASETMEKKDAVRFADLVVERNFPSAKAVHMPAIMRTKGVFGGMLMFFGYFANEYASVSRLTRSVATAKGLKATMLASATLLAYAAAASMFEAMLSGRGPPPPADGEDEPASLRWARWATMKTLLFPLQTNPIGLELVGGVERLVEGKPSNPRGAAWISVATDIEKAIRKASSDAEPNEKAGAALAVVLPAQLKREMTLMRSVEEGTIDTSNPFRVAAGIAYGTRENQGQSFLSLMADGWDMSPFAEKKKE